MPGQLPNELLSYIATLLDAETDLFTLQNLALASSVFLPIAYGRIFYHFHLYDKEAPTARTPEFRLFNLLKSSPRLAQYIKRLSIEEIRGPYWLTRTEGHEYFLNALRLLDVDVLQSFSLHRMDSSSWNRVPSETTREILRICQAPNLIDIDLWEVPGTFLRVCSPSVKIIRLHHTSIHSRDQLVPGGVKRTSPIVLKSLVLQDWNDDALVEEGSQISLTALEHLQIQALRAEFHLRVPKILRLCSRTLKSLNFKPFPMYSFFESSRGESFSMHYLITLTDA